jgi:hypothetical protein
MGKVSTAVTGRLVKSTPTEIRLSAPINQPYPRKLRPPTSETVSLSTYEQLAKRARPSSIGIVMDVAASSKGTTEPANHSATSLSLSGFRPLTVHSLRMKSSGLNALHTPPLYPGTRHHVISAPKVMQTCCPITRLKAVAQSGTASTAPYDASLCLFDQRVTHCLEPLRGLHASIQVEQVP